MQGIASRRARRIVVGVLTPLLVLSATVMGLVTTTPTPAGATEDPPPYLLQWGSQGAGDGQFFYPMGVAVDGAGNVYVADTYNHRVQKFDGAGNFVSGWGSVGSGDGQYELPSGVAVDGAGNVYVADTWNERVQKFDGDGNFLAKWGSGGAGDGQFQNPVGVAVDGVGDVYVVDQFNERVQKFDGDGNFLAEWGSLGFGDGQFQTPLGVAVDGVGDVYVVDQGNERVQKFDGDGNFLAEWGSGGAGDGQFQNPIGVAVDGAGDVYVADMWNQRVQKFDGDGNFLAKWGSRGAGNGQFQDPHGVAVDGDGNVYVADFGNHRIRKFGTAAAPLTYPVSVTLAGTGTGTVQSTPAGIDCGSTCTADFNSGDSITLTPTPDGGSVFTGWTGDCSGTGNCDLTMDGAKNATATFDVPGQHQLTYAKAGTGGGHVTSTPAGIDCTASCSAAFDAGTVTLHAAPNGLSTFTGWTGDCTGTGDCALDLTADQTATATYAPKVPVNTDDVVPVAGGLEYYSNPIPTTPTPLDQVPFSVYGTRIQTYGGFAYVRDYQAIIRIDIANRTAQRIAGAGYNLGDALPGAVGENALDVNIGWSREFAIGPTGDLYFTGDDNNHIYRVNASTGVVEVAAGSGVDGNSGDGGAATSAAIAVPPSGTAGKAMWVDSTGALWFTQWDANLGEGTTLRRVDPSGTITTVAGNGDSVSDTSAVPVGVPATSVHLPFQFLGVSAAGRAYFQQDDHVYVLAADGTYDVVASLTGTPCGTPYGAWFDGTHLGWISDFFQDPVRCGLDLTTGQLSSGVVGGQMRDAFLGTGPIRVQEVVSLQPLGDGTILFQGVNQDLGYELAIDQWLPAGLTPVTPVTPVDQPSWTVNSDGDHDDGACTTDDCTLREAINRANNTVGTDTISVDVTGTGTRTISLTSALPTITDPVVIDGTTASGYTTCAAGPVIELDGSGLPALTSGLVITAGGSTVKGLAIGHFPWAAIDLQGPGGNTVECNFLGTNAAGNASAANIIGVTTATTSGAGNTIRRNLISGNSYGVRGPLGSVGHNTVVGNRIGTDKAGTAAIPNVNRGIEFEGDGGHNTIGGTGAGDGNLISGNGVGLFLSGSSDNTVAGNTIGADVTGTADLGNTTGGVGISDFTAGTLHAATHNVVGGNDPAARNLISGNGAPNYIGQGVSVDAAGNSIVGNWIGTDATGNGALGNGRGVELQGPANSIVGNVISANYENGIQLSFDAAGNSIQGNLIGVGADGSTDLGNGAAGVWTSLDPGDSNTLIGGSGSGQANVIAHNGTSSAYGGVFAFTGSGVEVSANSIFANHGLGIDLDAVGVTSNDPGDADSGPNTRQNFPVLTNATSGTPGAIAGSLDSAPGTYRIEFFENATCDASGNGEGATYLGSVSAAANAPFSFPASLVDGDIVTATATNASGDTSEFSACIAAQPATPSLSWTVSGTGDHDDGSCTVADCTLREAINRANNTAGTDTISFDIPGGGIHTIKPVSALPEITDPVVIDGSTQPGASCPAGLGIELDGSSSNSSAASGLRISAGASTVRGLVINRFPHDGILLETGGSNTIECNLIGTDVSGATAKGNGAAGVEALHSPGNEIGGTSPGSGNVISGNGGGISIAPDDAGANIVQGNLVGTDVTGTAAIPNSSIGIAVTSPDNVIGGSAAGARNVISGNDGPGIQLGITTGTHTTGNHVEGNLIGTDVTGSVALGNGSDGIVVVGIAAPGATTGNVIGGTAPGAGNVISGNAHEGVQLSGADATGNVVQGNLIGTDATGTAALANGRRGVLVNYGRNNLIGGTSPGARNVLSGNTGGGVLLMGDATSSGNVVAGNLIGTRANGTGAIGNTWGVLLQDASGNTVGGTAAGAGNTIANSVAAGVLATSGTGNRILGNSIHDNASLGIDLGNDGVTSNDSGDADTGPNHLQNFPVLSGATSGAPGSIAGSLDSAPGTYRIEFFKNTVCDASGNGEGATYLGSLDTADNTPFTFSAGLADGDIVTATATDAAGNTSEFSACATATPPFATISVDKVTLPSGATQGFDFSLQRTSDSGTVGTIAGLHDADAPAAFAPVVGGSYKVVENVPAGWALTSATCDNTDTGPTEHIAASSLTVTAGEHWLCTVTNTQRGRIVVQKATLPVGDPQTFTFTGAAPATLADGGQTSLDVDPGTYTEFEGVQAGWDLTQIVCNDPGGDTFADILTHSVVYQVAPGEVITCTFTNTKRAEISVDKVTLPSGATQGFDFTLRRASDGGVESTITGLHDADAPAAFSLVRPTTYGITESIPTNWKLDSITCDDRDTGAVEAIDGALLTVGPGQRWRCTVTNEKFGIIEVVKSTTPAGGTGFNFSGAVNGTIGDGGHLTSNVAAGAYDVIEAAKAGWFVSGITCNDANSVGNVGTRTATFNIEPGEHVICTVQNTEWSTVTVNKSSYGGNGAFGFNLTGQSGVTATTTGSAGPNTPGTGSGAWSTLLAGNYTLTEDLAPLAGIWDLDPAITCTANGQPLTVTAHSNGFVTDGVNFHVNQGDDVACRVPRRGARPPRGGQGGRQGPRPQRSFRQPRLPLHRRRGCQRQPEGGPAVRHRSGAERAHSGAARYVRRDRRHDPGELAPPGHRVHRRDRRHHDECRDRQGDVPDRSGRDGDVHVHQPLGPCRPVGASRAPARRDYWRAVRRAIDREQPRARRGDVGSGDVRHRQRSRRGHRVGRVARAVPQGLRGRQRERHVVELQPRHDRERWVVERVDPGEGEGRRSLHDHGLVRSRHADRYRGGRDDLRTRWWRHHQSRRRQ